MKEIYDERALPYEAEELDIFRTDDSEFTPRLVFTSESNYTLCLGETASEETRLSFEYPEPCGDWWQQFEFQGQKYDLNIWEMESDNGRVVSAGIYVVRKAGELDETDTSDCVDVSVSFIY